MTTRPGRAADASPASPAATSRSACAVGSEVTTTSAPAAVPAGLVAAAPSRPACAASRDGSMS